MYDRLKIFRKLDCNKIIFVCKVEILLDFIVFYYLILGVFIILFLIVIYLIFDISDLLCFVVNFYFLIESFFVNMLI